MFLKEQGMARYRGAEVNKMMVLMAQYNREHFDDKVRAAAVMVEKEFGREVLSMQYSKIIRMICIVKNRGPDSWCPTLHNGCACLCCADDARHAARPE